MNDNYVLYYTTVKNETAELFIDNFAKIEPSKSIKDPVKQEAYLISKKQNLIDKASSKAVTGRVSAYALVKVGDPYIKSHTDIDERKLLLRLQGDIASLPREVIVFMKGSKNFTAPYLCRRFAANKVHNPFVAGNKNLVNLFDTSILIGTNSSACQEITSLQDDYWLISQGVLDNFNTESNWTQYVNSPNEDSYHQLTEECIYFGKVIAEYVEAFLNPHFEGEVSNEL